MLASLKAAGVVGFTPLTAARHLRTCSSQRVSNTLSSHRRRLLLAGVIFPHLYTALSIFRMPIEYQMCELFGLHYLLFGLCGYFDPTVDDHCAAHLDQAAIRDADRIVIMLARTAPQMHRPSSQTLHGLSFVEILRRLACNVHCSNHQRPSILANSMLFWLNAAASSPHLFAFSTQLEVNLRGLHLTLPRLAETTTNPRRWRQQLTEFLLELERSFNQLEANPGFQQMVLSTIDDMFDPYFHDFARNVMLEVTSRFFQGIRHDPEHPLDPTTTRYPLVRFYRQPAVRQYLASPVSSPTATTTLNFSAGNDIESTPPSPSPTCPDDDDDDNNNPPPLPQRSPHRNPSTINPPSQTSPSPSDPNTPHNTTSNETCPICLNPITPTSSTRKCSTCRTSFDVECLLTWAAACYRGLTCPCCRRRWAGSEEWVPVVVQREGAGFDGVGERETEGEIEIETEGLDGIGWFDDVVSVRGWNSGDGDDEHDDSGNVGGGGGGGNRDVDSWLWS